MAEPSSCKFKGVQSTLVDVLEVKDYKSNISFIIKC